MFPFDSILKSFYSWDYELQQWLQFPLNHQEGSKYSYKNDGSWISSHFPWERIISLEGRFNSAYRFGCDRLCSFGPIAFWSGKGQHIIRAALPDDSQPSKTKEEAVFPWIPVPPSVIHLQWSNIFTKVLLAKSLPVPSSTMIWGPSKPSVPRSMSGIRDPNHDIFSRNSFWKCFILYSKKVRWFLKSYIN